ncbi:hypothetical protein GIB67_010538 [Kingdonia uniflora]|uniref:Uncharacterized protein n=1 Tax=Kingdonia uniflora TaxID=39325 RepID=A0A7J7MAZ3_9MAGN|nr:hypothetical protein GIB67_010538 [Kingdonia uniflora]
MKKLREISDDEVPLEDLSDAEEKPVSPILASLHLYKDALTSNDESKISELEDFFQSIEDDKNSLSAKVATLFEELAVDSDHILRINFAFASFRATTEREQLSLVTNVKGEMVECLLSVLDSFERAKFEIKVETEGEEKINNSYQSIYKQFVEILALLGVVPPETVESTFDSLVSFS